ncbi:TPA: hypothetical protein LR331_002525 [Enterobacter hormaechei]|nr:hypothetical protein [Enterobacter hormaechei]
MSNIDKQAVQAVADLKAGYTLGHADVEIIQQMALDAVTLLDELEAAEKRNAELEARTVTVSLPDVMPPEAAPAHYWGSGESMAYADGYNKSTADLKASFAQACSSAGVNAEFE